MINIHSNAHAYQSAQSEQVSKSKDIEAIKAMHKESKARQYTQIISEIQAFVDTKVEKSSFEVRHQEFQDFLETIEYEGPSIASLSQEEAAELVSEDGFFGIKQTSERIAQFVIEGAGGDEELLREGRKGILQGFKDAEEMWGAKLPDISYETIERSVSMIDQALRDGGFSVLNETV